MLFNCPVTGEWIKNVFWVEPQTLGDSGSVVRDHPWVHSEFQASVICLKQGYVRYSGALCSFENEEKCFHATMCVTLEGICLKGVIHKEANTVH